MINRVGKMCVAAMSLCMIVLIVTRKRGDGRYFLLCDKPTTTLLINCCYQNCLVSLSHKVGVFLEEAICYFIYVKFAVMLGF